MRFGSHQPVRRLPMTSRERVCQRNGGGAGRHRCQLNGRNPTEAEVSEHVCAESAQKRASLPRTTRSEPEATYSHLSPRARSVSRSTKGRSRISPISGPAGCPPARPDCANCRHPANLTNHQVRTSQSSSLSDGSCPTPAVCDTRRDRLNWVEDRDRGTPRGATPPTPPGIRVAYPAVRLG